MPRRRLPEGIKRAACGVCRAGVSRPENFSNRSWVCGGAEERAQAAYGVRMWRVWHSHWPMRFLLLRSFCADAGRVWASPAARRRSARISTAHCALHTPEACVRRRMQAELEAQLAEVRSGGLVSAGTAERSTDGEDAASASITTLEGETMLLRMDLGGVRITERINPADGDGGPSTPPTMVYDCVSCLLLNTSAGYKAHFNRRSLRRLARLLPSARRRRRPKKRRRRTRTTRRVKVAEWHVVDFLNYQLLRASG